MISAAFLITLAKIAGVAIGTAALNNTIQGVMNSSKMKNAEYELKNNLQRNGMENTTVSDLINTLYVQGKINDTDFKTAMKTVEDIEKAKGSPLYILDVGISDGQDNWARFWKGTSQRKTNEYLNLYKILNDNVPGLSNVTQATIDSIPDNIRGELLSKAPALQDIIAPNYYDTDFKGEQLNVDPVHLYTGQELADLHGINYDVNHYYDLIKQGTEANVGLANYLSDQQNEASMIRDTADSTSYLGNIRNAKAEALAKGSTMGALKANELLANAETINNYAANQAGVANNRFNTVNQALKDDAQARLTAHDYFNSLAKSLSTDSMNLYSADSDRYAQQVLSNADMYRADQEARGNLALANSDMFRDYIVGQGIIDDYRASILNRTNGEANQYKWILDNAVRAGYTPAEAYLQLTDMLTHKYYGGDITTYYQNANK